MAQDDIISSSVVPSPAPGTIRNTPQTRRQDRTANACASCRSRKVKCCGNQPCQTCTRRGTECVFEAEDKRIVVSERYLRQLQKLGTSRTSETSEEYVHQNKRPRLARKSPSKIYSSETPSSNKTTVHDQGNAVVARNGNGSAASPGFQEEEQIALPIGDTPLRTQQSSGVQQPVLQHETEFATNPLASKTAYIKDPAGRQRLLGPTSTWSFCRRTLNVIKDHLSNAMLPDTPLYADGSSYDLKWSHVNSDAPPDTSRLPPLEYSIYLLNTVKFHIGNMYWLFDEPYFLKNMHEFYENATVKAQTDKLWFIQYLLVLAFGKAFLAQTPARQMPPGSEFFIRAMSIMPHTDTLHRQPVLAIEVLCLIALYLQSADMREAAYGYIGQALRIGLVEGFHRELPNDYMSPQETERCKNAWWTVYVLDRKFSSLMGAPNCVSDNDITASLPSTTNASRRAASLSLHVKISRLIARVLNTVYRVGGNLGGTFLTHMQDVLREMAELARELETVFEGKFTNSVGYASGAASHLNLSYHQCIIVATRPLLLCLLEQRLFDVDHAILPQRGLSAPVEGVLKTCVDSATKMLLILLAQHQDNLLETFLPFDLDHTVSAAFVLNMTRIIQPSLATDPTARQYAHIILDDMISKGSVPARLRQAEVEMLEQAVAHLELRGAQTTSPDPLTVQQTDAGQTPDTRSQVHGTAIASNTNNVIFNDTQASVANSLAILDMGLSPSQMLLIAEQLTAENFDFDFDTCTQDQWLWSGFAADST